MKVRDDGWELLTPDYDYVKEPYWVREHEGGPVVLCYPNAGVMHEMSGFGRMFEPCLCEVQLAGWEEDPHHPMNRGKRDNVA